MSGDPHSHERELVYDITDAWIVEELIGKLSFIDKDVSLQEVVLLNVLFRRLVSVEQASLVSEAEREHGDELAGVRMNVRRNFKIL